MTPAILFIDRDDRFVSEVRRVLGDSFAGYDIRYATENVMRVPRGDALFVSPANSLGFMDGGIDAAYMDMFPGIEPRVKSAIAKLGYTTSLGQPYMSVGSAVVVPAQPEANAWLASCPTMFLPGNMPMDECAAQIRQALLDRARGAARPEAVDAGVDAYITASTDALQPSNYMHRQIQAEPGGIRHPG
eukprot:jgi/Tetstr1/454108/TSEL_041027.t1